MSTATYKHDISSLCQLLGQDDSYCYCIPNYQRVNVWGDNNVKRFLTDIIDRIARHEQRPDGDGTPCDMFIGTMIFAGCRMPVDQAPQGSGRRNIRVRKVVDGQQRLMVANMACSKLYDILESKMPEVDSICGSASKTHSLAKEFMKEFLKVLTVDLRMPRMISLISDKWQGKGAPGRYWSPLAKLVSKYCAPAERGERVRRGRATAAQKSFDKALKAMHNSLDELCRTGKIEDCELPDVQSILECKSFSKQIQRIANVVAKESHSDNATIQYVYRAMLLGGFLMTHVKILWLQTHDEDDAFDLFEALNATGVQLTSIETFKPEVVKELTQERYGNSEEKLHFDAIEECLGTDEAKRAELSTEVVTATYLAETGNELRNKHIRSQRARLRKAYESSIENDSAASTSPTDSLEFVRQLRCCAELVDAVRGKMEEHVGIIFLEDRGFRETLSSGGGAGFSLAYCQALKHTSCVPVLSRLYHQLTTSSMSDRDRDLKPEAIPSMCDSVKNVAAFYACMRLLGYKASAVDDAHKRCMKEFSRTTDSLEITAPRIRAALAEELTVALSRKQNDEAEDLREAFLRVCSEELAVNPDRRTVKYVLLLSSYSDNAAIPRSVWSTQVVLRVVPDSDALGQADRLGNLMLMSSNESKAVQKLHKDATKWRELLEKYARVIKDEGSFSYKATKSAVKQFLAAAPRITDELLDGELDTILAHVRKMSQPENLQLNVEMIKNHGVELAEFAWQELAEGRLGIGS